MAQARLNLDEYTTRVLDVVKGKYGLKNREDALNKFVKEYGGDFVEPSVNEEYLKELDFKLEEHKKKYPNGNTMTLKELDELLGIES